MFCVVYSSFHCAVYLCVCARNETDTPQGKRGEL